MPIFCEEIFQGIDEKKQGGDVAQYEVLFEVQDSFTCMDSVDWVKVQKVVN